MTDTEVDLVDDVVDSAAHRGTNLVTEELVRVIQRHDPVPMESNSYGVSEDRVVAYAEALPDEGDRVTPEDVRTAFSERTADSESWVGGDTLYRTDEGYVSAYPRDWHEALEGEDDVRRFLEVILAEVGDSEDAFGRGGPGAGVPEDELLDAVAVLGPLSRQEAKRRLQDLRDEGVVAESLDQHPDDRVRLADVDHD